MKKGKIILGKYRNINFYIRSRKAVQYEKPHEDTALTMVIAGLTSRTDITPYTVAQYAQKHHYYVNGIGSSWDLISEGGSAFGVKAHVMGTDKGSIYLRLR
ncbi:hypothetical protein EDD61_103168 [Longicatena caecimuris]|uniref:Uncharacterized protein n=1 Tax=Longicatena caecimuris TaxID=1796635 RepID=A0A4R3TN14_9FIRM|nr:hypothetical protein [Longicatena caecimuris]TCU62753.1 hypothetical protein EDD61_103168 [Longicatena caecimuris]